MYIVALNENPELIDCNIPEDQYDGETIDVWAAGSYSAEAICYLDDVTPNSVWECLTGTTEKPGTGADWSQIGVTDRYLMLDLKTVVQSQHLETLYIEIDASNSDTVGLFNIEANGVEFDLWHDGASVKNETILTYRAGESSWYNYFFSDYDYKKTIIWRFPYYSASTLKITISQPTGQYAKCGVLALGTYRYLGGTLFNPNLSLKSFSIIEEDDFGIPTFIPRGRARKMEVDIWFPSKSLDAVYYALEAQDAKPVIFNCNNAGTTYETLVAFGFYRAFELDLEGPNYSRCSLSIEEIAKK
jgi:hypothetical protein